MKQLIYLMLLSSLITGCAGFEMGNGGPRQGQIVMEGRSEIEVNSHTNRTRNGTHLDQFWCPGMKVCNTYASRKFCRCQVGGDIYLPSRLGL